MLGKTNEGMTTTIINLHQTRTPSRYECLRCGRTFEDHFSYLLHVEYGHSKVNSTYKCLLCGRDVKRLPCFVKHLIGHGVRLPYGRHRPRRPMQYCIERALAKALKDPNVILPIKIK